MPDTHRIQSLDATTARPGKRAAVADRSPSFLSRFFPMPVHAAVILAGGRSRRMGFDKAGAQICGWPMLAWTVRAARQAVERVIVAGREQPPAGWPRELADVEFLDDRTPRFAGPAGGIITALQHVNETVLVLACDLPLVKPALLHGLIRAHEAEGKARMTFCRLAGSAFIEPTVAVYTPEVLAELYAVMESGRSLQKLAHLPHARVYDMPAEWTDELVNVNNPESFVIAERIMRDVDR